MMRILVFVAVVALVATLSIPVLASEAERSAQEIGTGIDEFATPTPPPVVGDEVVVVEVTLCPDDGLECDIRAQHMNSGHEAD